MPLFDHRSLSTTALRCLTSLVLLSGPAAIASETETFTSSSLLGPTSQPDSLAFPSFDTNLGTLESVVVTLKFNVCPEITITNDTSSTLSFSGVTLTAPFSVTGPGSFTYNNSTLTTSPLSGTAAPGSSTTYEPAVGWIYAVKGATTNSLGFWEDQPGDLVDLVVTPGDLVTNAGSSSGLNVSSTALEWEGVSVKYTYLSTAAVPEPSGKYLAFIVGTAMALVAIGRRVRLGA